MAEMDVARATLDGKLGSSALKYQPGFGNEFATEAVEGALPRGQNSPQRPPLGLFSELVSATSFAAPRASNRRSYLFRIRPSTSAAQFVRIDNGLLKTPPLEIGPYPGALRWAAFAMDGEPADFIDGLFTVCGNGSPQSQTGMAVHVYRANRSMENRVFSNADGEMLILPQEGALRIVTELGLLDVGPGEFTLLPKGLKFAVEITGQAARGFVCENFGLPFVLPDLGLIGSHGLANSINFLTPVAAFENRDGSVELVHKYAGNLWAAQLDHSPFDVVAWRGNWAPCKFDMRQFVVMGTLSVDHPDPSIFCALTSPSSAIAGSNVDFMVLPPRWVVAENTFRPPGFHRNAVAEFLALIEGAHESRANSFPPGSMSLHNNWTAHGPDVETFEAGRVATLEPQKIEDALVFMLETRFPLELSAGAMSSEHRQLDCTDSWTGFRPRFPDNN